MSQHPENPETIAKGEVSLDRPDADRRRFLVAGLVAAPIIMTLSARPALAQVNGSLGNYTSQA